MPVTIVGNNTPTAGGVVYGDGTNYASTSAGTSGQPIVSGGAGAPTFRPFTLPSADGTNGQVLQTNGSGALSFATPATGAMTFISVTTVSGTPSTVDITSGISSTYDDYLILFENVAFSANASLFLNVYKSAAFQTTDYSQYYTYSVFNGTTGATGGIGDTQIRLTFTALSTNRRFGTLYMLNANSTTAHAQGFYVNSSAIGASATGTDNTIGWGGGTQGTAAAITGLRFYPNTGTFTSGTFRLYGIQKS